MLCLTLGALAELEARLMAGDLVGLSERFASGRVSARDLTAIIGAGLRGGGNAVSDDDLARMSIEGGLQGRGGYRGAAAARDVRRGGMTPFPWSDAMRLGFGVLRLSSQEFWGLTPRELAAAFGGERARTRRAGPRATLGR